MNRIQLYSSFVILVGSLVLLPQNALAHRSGCHTLHTCEPDSNNYVCGDLGYPCNGATRLEDIDPKTVFVPVVTEKMFMDEFGRKPTVQESEYWKKRFRADKNSIFKIRPAMRWHKANASFGPRETKVRVSPVRTATVDLTADIEKLFSSVYEGRMPTPSEKRYWLVRLKEKNNAPAIIGAMTFHKERGINH